MSAKNIPARHQPALAAFTKLICLATFGLIFAGGVVTSKNVGLSVPDWPTSFGYQMWSMPFSMWRGGVFYEHTHRVLASMIGSLMMIAVVWILWKESRRRVRIIALTGLALVILQGILGGVGVLLTLPVVVSVAHGVLAQLFFCLTIVLAYACSRECRERPAAAVATASYVRLACGTRVLIALVAAQLVLAAFMRHDLKPQGGVAIPDFPRTAGRWIPWVTDDSVDWVNAWRENAVWEHDANFDLGHPVRTYQLVVHLAHRALAAVLVVAVIWLTLAARRAFPAGDRVRHTVYGLDALLLVQVALGACVVWSNKGELITSFHVVTGAGILGGTVLMALRVMPATWAAPETITD